MLDTLGIKQDIVQAGTPTTSIIFQNHHGKQIGEFPSPSTLIKRGQLTKILREAALESGVAIEFGKRLTDVEITSDQRVSAHFEDGSEAHGDLLVGCDGIQSQTRRSVMPSAPRPRYLGLIGSGGFTPNSVDLPPEDVTRMTFGLKGFFGYQVIPSGEVFWFENFTQSTEPDQGHFREISDETWRTKLLDLHRDDHSSIQKIIHSADEIGKYPIYEMPSLPTWHTGPVCLIGDAAHAMSPSGGQGASMALEDATVLAKCLRDISNVGDAFATFEQLRKDRVEKIVTDARRNSHQKRPTNPVTLKIRDPVLPFLLRMGVKSAKQTNSYKINWKEKVT